MPTLIRYRTDWSETTRVRSVADLVEMHVQRRTPGDDEHEDARARIDALQALVGELLDKDVAYGVVSADELIAWLDIDGAHDASVWVDPDVMRALREQSGASLPDCRRELLRAGGDIDKAAKRIATKGLA
jgi:hypothetical protein